MHYVGARLGSRLSQRWSAVSFLTSTRFSMEWLGFLMNRVAILVSVIWGIVTFSQGRIPIIVSVLIYPWKVNVSPWLFSCLFFLSCLVAYSFFGDGWSLGNLCLASSNDIVHFVSDALNLVLSIETSSDLFVCLNEAFEFFLEAVVLIVEISHMLI